jgi:putative glutamine amidotransferase
MSRPVVLVPACNRLLGQFPSQYPNHTVGRKYIDAVRLAGCLPLIVPFAEVDEIDELLDLADGVFLTGSPSNVHPSRFGESVLDETLPLDPLRDGWTLPLVPRALERGVPLFAVCRGFQEANVALGGSLHQAVHTVAGRNDHRGEPEGAPEVAYAVAHPVAIEPGGTLERLLGREPIAVNSVHGQGLNRLAAGLRVEARAPDGLIEAVSAPGAPAFNLCVQWHPEWRASENAVSMRMLNAFGDACRAHRRERDQLRK